VRGAVDIALMETASADHHKVYTIGPLIHNPSVLENLKSRGIEILDEDAVPVTGDSKNSKNGSAAGATAVIRAHGISPQLETRLRELGFRIEDATCPKVKKSQTLAEELSKAGYRVFLAGERRHAEITGILGYAPDGIVVEDADSALQTAKALFREESAAKTALIAQTTISADDFTAIGEAIKKIFPDVKILNTICPATRERQNALKELCEKSDAVIIAGGKNSANTRHLLAIAEAVCFHNGKPAVLVENAAGVPEEFFQYETIGVSAGASTPDEVIDEIESMLKAQGTAFPRRRVKN
jgi:4-hydroxy-3-methylbut-2-enyl diphosphate reductase